MSDARPVICRRCGFSNVAGDQFCGSCGAFLEWEGEPTTDAGADTGAPPATPAAPGPAVAPTTWAPAPAPVPAPVPPPVAAATSGADAGLVRCPSCGIANPVTRTFCQSCGTTLTAATPLADASVDRVAAAVAAVPGSAGTSPVTPVPPAVAAPRAGAPSSRGIPGWLVGLVALGVLAGVVLVAMMTVLKGAGPSTGATTGPSLGQASAGPSAGSSAAPGDSASPGESTTPGGSTPPQEAVRLKLTGATASSVVGNRAKFQPEMVFDDSQRTAWQEGSPTEKGQWIEVTFASARVDQLIIWNGYQASVPLFKGNLRLKDVLISVNGGQPKAVRLKDATKGQFVDLGGISGATSLRIEIVSTYPSQKTSVAGTPFDDAAVSEIRIMGVPGG